MKTRTNQPIYKDNGTLLTDEDLGGGTEVIANPTLAGTEDPLTGLQIGDTKYALGGGNGFKHAYFVVAKTRYESTFNGAIQFVYFSNTDNLDTTSIISDIGQTDISHFFIVNIISSIGRVLRPVGLRMNCTNTGLLQIYGQIINTNISATLDPDTQAITITRTLDQSGGYGYKQFTPIVSVDKIY